MMYKKVSLALALCSSVLCSLSNAQNCPPPAIVANARSSNLFSPEQETIFGELIVQGMAGEARFIRDEKLVAYINSDFSHFAFSQDGKLLLAQDDFAITVIERDPLRALFQIPVEKAREAAFTQDGKFIVFTIRTLRYEKWSVAERKPVEVRELVLRRNCLEHKLSPDGNYLACNALRTRIT
jgi:hypothetical protein